MNPKLKLAAYAILLLMAAWFGWGFYSNYNAVTAPPVEASANATPNVATNVSPQTTNMAEGSNNVAATNAEPVTPSPNKPDAAPPEAVKKGLTGNVITYLGALVGCIIGLGLLVAHDVTQFMGNVAVDVLFDDGGAGQRDPEYERAEQVWANGKHLEAIQMMRDFLKSNPRAQYAALRIAEIYEKDLHNHVAASMEYEDVLKQKLPAERWGWAAIHLCNLYSKLHQQDKAMALLQRIADDYPKTAAAKKARARLGIAEPEPEPLEQPHTQPAGQGENAPPPENLESFAEEEELPPPPEEPPKPSLPPGFRPKK